MNEKQVQILTKKDLILGIEGTHLNHCILVGKQHKIFHKKYHIENYMF